MQEKVVPWKEWCGIRDIFAHQYSNLDCQSAWETIQHDLPELNTEIARILKKNDEQKKMNFEIINQEAMERDIADYAKDSRLTEPSEGKCKVWYAL